MIKSKNPGRPFKLRSVRYQGKLHKGCVLYTSEQSKEIRILAPKNRIYFTNRELSFLNKQVPLISLSYNATTTVAAQGKKLTLNSDIVIEFEEASGAARIYEILSEPRKELEKKSRQLLFQAEGHIRGFLETREDALEFQANLRTNPRKTMLDLSTKLADIQAADPLATMTSVYSEMLTKSWDEVHSSISGIEKELGNELANRLYAVTYFIGELQDALFEGKDPKKIERLKSFGAELGFDEGVFEGITKKSENDPLLDLFQDVRLIDLPGFSITPTVAEMKQ